MIKKLLHGFFSGLGFSLAVVLVVFVIGKFNVQSHRVAGLPVMESGSTIYLEQEKWREQDIEEKIENLSGVALLRFKKEENDLMAAYLAQVVVKDGSMGIPFAVGDRVKNSDYYPQGGITRNRDGILLMYAGEPPKEMEGAYLYDSRLVAYGDMPLDVFLKKFDEARNK